MTSCSAQLESFEVALEAVCAPDLSSVNDTLVLLGASGLGLSSILRERGKLLK